MTDYTREPWAVKLRKAARYARLYGPRRTRVKAQAQHHMHRSFPVLPAPQPRTQGKGHVGLLGCGKFGFAHIAYFLDREYGPVLRGVMDIDPHRAASLSLRYGADFHTEDAERVLDDPAIDLVYVASNHASHAPYAIAALERGKHVHVEKPHVTSDAQLDALCQAMEHSPGKVGLGFNRPNARLGVALAEAFSRERGPGAFSWFVVGHELDEEHWYARPEEGGRVFGNLCHWTDFTLRLVPPEQRYPIEVRPTVADKRDCDIAVTLRFGDGTIASISFSAKGETFEGVRERLAAQRGDTIAFLDDFERLTLQRGAKRQVLRSFHRDPGHRETILASYALARPDTDRARAASVADVRATGELFLRVKDALDGDQVVVVESPASTARAPT